MEVAVTGAAGFLGSAIVESLMAAGHQVRALVRPGAAPAILKLPAQSIYAVSLADQAELAQVLNGVEAVIHVAAALSGEFAKHQKDTLEATSSLLAVMHRVGIQHLIGISSYAVYDYLGIPDNATLDESSPVDAHPAQRSAYAHAKILQERLFLDFLGAHGHRGMVFRPGIVYDQHRLWQPQLGRALGARIWLAMGPDAAIPMVHVSDVAAAVALGLHHPADGGVVVNLVETAPPRREALLAALASAQQPGLRVVHFPWLLHRWIAATAGWLNRTLFGQRLPLPGLLRSAELAAGFKPLHHSNVRARQMLGWEPRYQALAFFHH
jgi:nucleoside-diphosphate-sugar epimerase